MPALVVVTSTDEERLWRGMVLQVFAFDWDRGLSARVVALAITARQRPSVERAI